MNWLKGIAGKVGGFLGKLGPMKALKSVGKKLLTNQLRKESSRLLVQVQAILERDGLVEVDELFDSWQRRLITAVNMASFLPESVRKDGIKIVQEEGDELQIKLKALVKEKGAEGLNLAFALATEKILKRIEAF